ncbi:MAG: hypothetical protein ACR652_20705 [Methylocystis sp.]|uniref:hypothetical protein n=1 Tax=Methylocystis sp. TaxID=1911079 RepID=UPI003DA2D1DC
MARSTASQSASPESSDVVAARRASEDAAGMASYIADMSSELSHLAAGAELQMVAYFLNLARVEAEIRARELGGYAVEREKPPQSGA